MRATPWTGSSSRRRRVSTHSSRWRACPGPRGTRFSRCPNETGSHDPWKTSVSSPSPRSSAGNSSRSSKIGPVARPPSSPVKSPSSTGTKPSGTPPLLMPSWIAWSYTPTASASTARPYVGRNRKPQRCQSPKLHDIRPSVGMLRNGSGRRLSLARSHGTGGPRPSNRVEGVERASPVPALPRNPNCLPGGDPPTFPRWRLGERQYRVRRPGPQRRSQEVDRRLPGRVALSRSPTVRSAPRKGVECQKEACSGAGRSALGSRRFPR